MKKAHKHKLSKFFIGLLLVPLCAVVTQTFYGLVTSLGIHSVDDLSRSGWWLLLGFGLWIALFAALPTPTRSYVFAHELTHAIWAWACGARVHGVKVGRDSGYVSLSKSNFLITLAPYFFPFYTLLAIVLYAILTLFYNLSAYEPFWLGAIGLTWSFHLTFTLRTLASKQPDIQENGRLFSYSLIYLLNVLGLCFWVVAVSEPTLSDFIAQWGKHSDATWSLCWKWSQQFIALVSDLG